MGYKMHSEEAIHRISSCYALQMDAMYTLGIRHILASRSLAKPMLKKIEHVYDVVNVKIQDKISFIFRLHNVLFKRK